MDDQPQPKGSIADEFRDLGQNLVDTLRAAWESPERKKLQDEIGDGLDQLADTIRMEVDAFTSSPTGQRLKTDLDDLHQRVRSGEAEAKAREELLKALRLVNAELKKASNFWGQPQNTSQPEETAASGEEKSPGE